MPNSTFSFPADELTRLRRHVIARQTGLWVGWIGLLSIFAYGGIASLIPGMTSLGVFEAYLPVLAVGGFMTWWMQRDRIQDLQGSLARQYYRSSTPYQSAVRRHVQACEQLADFLAWQVERGKIPTELTKPIIDILRIYADRLLIHEQIPTLAWYSGFGERRELWSEQRQKFIKDDETRAWKPFDEMIPHVFRIAEHLATTKKKQKDDEGMPYSVRGLVERIGLCYEGYEDMITLITRLWETPPDETRQLDEEMWHKAEAYCAAQDLHKYFNHGYELADPAMLARIEGGRPNVGQGTFAYFDGKKVFVRSREEWDGLIAGTVKLKSLAVPTLKAHEERPLAFKREKGKNIPDGWVKFQGYTEKHHCGTVMELGAWEGIPTQKHWKWYGERFQYCPTCKVWLAGTEETTRGMVFGGGMGD